MSQKKTHQYYKLVTGFVLLSVSVGLLLSNRGEPQSVLGDVASTTPEVTIGDFGGQDQYLVTLKTSAVGGNGIGNGPNGAFSEQQLESVKSSVVDRNQEILDDSQTEEFDQLPIIAADLTTAEAQQLASDPDVAAVEQSKIRFPTLDQSVPHIRADEVYTDGYDGAGYAVAILDTGVDNTHSFIDVISEACYSNSNGFGGGISLCPNGQPTQVGAGAGDDCSGISSCDHGTHVAGIAAGNGTGASYTGVANAAEVIAIQVFTTYDASTCLMFFGYTPCLGASDTDIISGLNRVLQLHNDSGFTTPIASVNLSLGGGLYSSQSACDSSTASYLPVIQSLKTAGIATVIASGNDSSSTHISSPGCASNAIAVGSSTISDSVSGFSNGNSMLDILAPGSSISSSVSNGGFGNKSGTSMATPHVAGTFAILKQASPTSTVDEILSSLQTTGVNILDSRNSLNFSRIDVKASVDDLVEYRINATVIDGSSSEAGGTARVQFSLSSLPTADVSFGISLSDTSEATLGGTSNVTITPANWNNPQNNQVTITGLDDSIFDGNESYTLVTANSTSSDTNFAFDANTTPDVSLTNTDNENVNPHNNNFSALSSGRRFAYLDTSNCLFMLNKKVTAFHEPVACHVDDFQIEIDRVGILQEDNLVVKEGPVRNRWWRINMPAKDFQLAGKRIGLLSPNDTLYIKEGALNAGWKQVATNVKSFRLLGNRVAYIDQSDRLYAKIGSVTASWQQIATNARDFTLAGNRIAYTNTTGQLYVKEGGITAPWTYLNAVVNDYHLSGKRIVYVTTDNRMILKDGSVRAPRQQIRTDADKSEITSFRILAEMLDDTLNIYLKGNWIYFGTAGTVDTEQLLLGGTIISYIDEGLLRAKDPSATGQWTDISTQASKADIAIW